MEKRKRVNTYTNKEYFKIVLLAATKDQTYSFSEFLSGNSKPQRGVFYSSYNKTQLIVFPRFISKLDHQATTVAVEGLIIYLEKEQEFEEIKTIFERYEQIPVRVIVSEFDATELAKSIGGLWYKKNNDPKDLKDYVNRLDHEEFKKIKLAFEKYDKDNGGTIDNEEMTEIACSMGFNADDEEFKKGIYALDLNQDGTISFTEFIAWWKIGRQNLFALPKIYDLFEFNQKLIKDHFDLSNYTEKIVKIEEDKTNEVSSQRLLFRSPGVFKIKSKVELSIAVGPEKRIEMATEFLKQFTSNTGSAKANWLSILVPLNSKTRKLDSNKAKYFLDEFKDHCLDWASQNMGPAFTAFFKNLLVFETNSNENSVILALRLKIDIEDLVKQALKSFIFALHNLQPENKSTWMRFKAYSNLDLYDAFTNENITLENFLEVCELIVEGGTFKDQFKAFYQSLDEQFQEDFAWLQFFFQPSNVDIEADCNIKEFLSDDNKSGWLQTSLKKMGLFLDFLRNGLSKDLISSAENIEICLNAFDIFARFKIFTQKAFSDSAQLEKVLS